MAIMIGARNFSDYMNRDSLKIRYYGSYKSDCSLILELDSKVPFSFLSAGMEMKIYDESNLLVWGGIVQKITYKYRSSDFVSVRVFGQGYESVFSHRVLSGVNTTFQNVRNIISNVHTKILADEGISFSTVGMPSIIRQITLNFPGAVSALEYMDYISNFYGIAWRIDKNKVLSYTEGYPVNKTSFTLDLNGAFADGVSEVSIMESVEDYRNTQYISIKDNYSKQTDNNGVLSMKNLFGSGLYEKVTKNFNVTDTSHGNELAQKVLNNFSEIPKFIKFTVKNKNFSLFDGIKVKGGIIGNTYADYVIVSVEDSYMYGAKFSSVICRCFSGNKYLPLANQTGKVSFNI